MNSSKIKKKKELKINYNNPFKVLWNYKNHQKTYHNSKK